MRGRWKRLVIYGVAAVLLMLVWVQAVAIIGHELGLSPLIQAVLITGFGIVVGFAFMGLKEREDNG